MSWTKRQFVEAAYEEVGYASYAFDLEPEQLEKALWRLDSMMAVWNALGIRVGYPIPSSPEDSDLDTETNVPDSTNEAIYTNLAIKLAPTIGKTPSRETKVAAKTSYLALMNKHVKPEERQLDGSLPAGAGNKRTINDRQYIDQPNEDQLQTNGDGILDFE